MTPSKYKEALELANRYLRQAENFMHPPIEAMLLSHALLSMHEELEKVKRMGDSVLFNGAEAMTKLQSQLQQALSELEKTKARLGKAEEAMKYMLEELSVPDEKYPKCAILYAKKLARAYFSRHTPPSDTEKGKE